MQVFCKGLNKYKRIFCFCINLKKPSLNFSENKEQIFKELYQDYQEEKNQPQIQRFYEKNDQKIFVYSFDDNKIMGLKSNNNEATQNFNVELDQIKQQNLKFSDFLNDSQNKKSLEQILQPPRKNLQKQILQKQQILTGNLWIDMAMPIQQGNVLQIIQDNKREQLQDLLKNIVVLNKDTYYLYLSIDEYNLKQIQNQKEFQSDNFFTFQFPKKDKLELFLSLHLVTQLIQQLKNSSKNIVLLFDNIYDLSKACFDIQKDDQNDQMLQFLRNIYVLTEKQKHNSLTTIFINKDQTQNMEFHQLQIKQEISLMENLKINLQDQIFGNKQQQILKVFPSIVYKNRNMNKLHLYLLNKLQDLLIHLKQLYEVDSKFNEFNIERDICDKFELLDSQIYLPMIFNQKTLDKNQSLLVLNLVLYLVQNDLISYFDMNQNEILNAFLDFVKKDNSFLDQKTSLDYLELNNVNDYDPETVLTSLNLQCSNFFNKLKEENKIREYKNDYCNFQLNY